MKNLREVKDDLLKEWLEFREETAFSEMTPQDKKYCIYFEEIAERILKNVPEQNKKYVQKQLDQLEKNFMNYLNEHKKADYSIMLLDGTLNTHLKEIQEQATSKVEQIIKQLKDNSDLTEKIKNADMLYWVGTMNAIKNQAEEIVCSELIYV